MKDGLMDGWMKNRSVKMMTLLDVDTAMIGTFRYTNCSFPFFFRLCHATLPTYFCENLIRAFLLLFVIFAVYTKEY